MLISLFYWHLIIFQVLQVLSKSVHTLPCYCTGLQVRCHRSNAACLLPPINAIHQYYVCERHTKEMYDPTSTLPLLSRLGWHLLGSYWFALACVIARGKHLPGIKTCSVW